MGQPVFSGILKDICLAYTPEAKVDDYVIVHVGFALNQLDEAEAQEIFTYLEQIGEAAALEEAEPAGPEPADSQTQGDG